jgi:copper homeostasis protein
MPDDGPRNDGPAPTSDPAAAAPTIEVVVTHESDAEQAELGGSDRLLACAVVDDELRAPDPSVVSAIRRVSDGPLWVVLRPGTGPHASGGEVPRLIGLAGEFLSVGATGVTLGFLTRDLEVDTQAIAAVVDAVPGLSWRLDRCFDQVLDQRLALRQLRARSDVAGVYSGGGATGSESGFEELVTRAQDDPAFATLVTVCEMRPEQVPWLLRAGVRQFQLGSDVRTTRSWTRAFVDAARVRSWRTLLDDLVRPRPDRPRAR